MSKDFANRNRTIGCMGKIAGKPKLCQQTCARYALDIQHWYRRMKWTVEAELPWADSVTD